MKDKVLTDKIVFAILALFVFVGISIRLYGLENRGLWYDELGLWFGALSNKHGAHDGPLSHWLTLIYFYVTRNTSPLATHIPTALFGVLAIPATYLLGENVGTRFSGLLSSTMITMCPMAIFYSQEARPYGLFIFLTAILYFAFLTAHKRNSNRLWLFYGLMVALCSLTHLLIIQTLIALSVFSFASITISSPSSQNIQFRLRRFFNFVITSLVGSIIGLFWVFGRWKVTSVLEGVYPYSVVEFLRTALVSLGPKIYYTRRPSYGFPDVLGSIFLLTFFMGLWWFYKQKKNELILFFLIILCIPLYITYCNLGLKGDWAWLRYISHLLVPYLVVVGIGLETMLNFIHKRTFKIAAAFLFFLCFYPGILSWVQDASKSRSEQAIRQTGEIASKASYLEGVIIFTRHGSMRVPSLYYLYRKDRLPIYQVFRDKIFRIRGVSSLGNLTTIPQKIRIQKDKLKSGAYALFGYSDWPRDCEDLSQFLKDGYMVNHSDKLSYGGEVNVCAVVNSRRDFETDSVHQHLLDPRI